MIVEDNEYTRYQMNSFGNSEYLISIHLNNAIYFLFYLASNNQNLSKLNGKTLYQIDIINRETGFYLDPIYIIIKFLFVNYFLI